jgi:hypothetical protein
MGEVGVEEVHIKTKIIDEDGASTKQQGGSIYQVRIAMS